MGKIDKVEHVMADYWQNEEVDVILFRDIADLMLTSLKSCYVSIPINVESVLQKWPK